MKSIVSAVVAALLLPAAVFAQDVPATQPATQPSTKPAAQAVAADAKVAIVPFTPVEVTDPDWIGRAVQQSLLADLSRGQGVPIQPVGDASKITTVSEAVEAGKRVDARYVIFGTYQHMEPNLRITGQIVDVSSGKVIAGLKSTGSIRDLFDMQDNLAFQAKWGLGTERLNQTAAANPPAPAAQPGDKPAIQPQGPVVLSGDRYADSDLSRAVADGRSLIERNDAAGQSFREQNYNDNTYPPYYGGWGYGFPYANWWWGSRVIIIRDHDHDHDHHHRDIDYHGGLSGGARSDGRDYSRGVGNVGGSYPMTMQSAPRNYNQFQRNYNQAPRNFVAPQPRTFQPPVGNTGGGAKMVNSPMRGGTSK